MELEFTVRATVERQEGPFASREELTEAVRTELEGADPSTLDGSNGGTYEVTSWEVEDVDRSPLRSTRPVHVALSVVEARALLGLRKANTNGAALRAIERLTAALPK